MRQQDGTAQTEVVLDSGLAYFELQGTSSAGRFLVRFGGNVVTASGFTVLRAPISIILRGRWRFSRAMRIWMGKAGWRWTCTRGESALLNAANPDNYQLAESIEPDSWDAWNSDRDPGVDGGRGAAHGSYEQRSRCEQPAWNDLDASGNWYNVPGQGYVWSAL